MYSIIGAYPVNGGSYNLAASLPLNQPAAIIKNENGMYTIRNPALHQAVTNGLALGGYSHFNNVNYYTPQEAVAEATRAAAAAAAAAAVSTVSTSNDHKQSSIKTTKSQEKSVSVPLPPPLPVSDLNTGFSYFSNNVTIAPIPNTSNLNISNHQNSSVQRDADASTRGEGISSRNYTGRNSGGGSSSISSSSSTSSCSSSSSMCGSYTRGGNGLILPNVELLRSSGEENITCDNNVSSCLSREAAAIIRPSAASFSSSAAIGKTNKCISAIGSEIKNAQQQKQKSMEKQSSQNLWSSSSVLSRLKTAEQKSGKSF